jgi:serine/threonine protein kinase/TolB-like protein/Flp pilus assembly protein TadD
MKLSSAQIALMSRLLDEALQLDQAGRRRWLETLPPECQDLAPYLRRGLLPAEIPENWLHALPRIGLADGPGSTADSGLQPGARVGPYELIRLLGAGGMAEVWLARRADGAFKRDMALKLPLRSRLRQDLDPRFARERDILASLEHPRIARLYDAGIAKDGLPYLAMEYVQGQLLTEWCDAHRVGIAERLQLVLQVLEAVSYAHERSVIHRDLKPSNILVTGTGQVRLLDFGVAKLLEGEDWDRTELTGVYGRALTANYASPELLRGDPVDARSDIYSVGVLLYELLTGARPYVFKTAASLGMLEQAIAAIDVEKPSLKVGNTARETGVKRAGHPVQQLRGDLDAITLKALAKSPSDRYPSAAALAADLRCYLEGKPINALPARVADRVTKFVRRNRRFLGVTAGSIAAVLATLGYAVYRDHVTSAIIGTALTPSDVGEIPEKSVAVLPFADMSERHDQEYFSDGLAEELSDLLAQVPDLRVTARTSSFYFKGKQATIAEIARTLGVAHVLEGSVRKSGNTLRVTVQLIRADSGFRLWSKTFDRDLKDIFKVQDEVAGAVVEALKAKLAPAQATSHRTSNPEAYNEFLIARQFDKRGDFESYRRSVEAYRRSIELDPNYAAAYAGLAVAESFVADFTGDAASLKLAESDAEKAVSLAPEEADVYGARGYLRTSYSWNWAGAHADFAKALALDPADSTVQRHYGYLEGSLGHLPEAIAAYRKAVELDPLANAAWNGLGWYLMHDREFSAADASFSRALRIEPENPYALNNLGTLQLLEGRAESALTTFGKVSLEGFRLTGIAMAQHTLRRVRESQRSLDQAIARTGQNAAYQIAEVHAWRGEKDHAFEWLERAYQQRDGGLSAGIKTDPLLASLRADPRYRALVRKMDLPE